MEKEAMEKKTTSKNQKKGIRRTSKQRIFKKKEESVVESLQTCIPNHDDHSHLSLFIGSTEGGFLSLEEIDECDYYASSSSIPRTTTTTSKQKKRKRDYVEEYGGVEEEEEEKKENNRKKKDKKKKSQKRKGAGIENNYNEASGDPVVHTHQDKLLSQLDLKGQECDSQVMKATTNSPNKKRSKKRKKAKLNIEKNDQSHVDGDASDNHDTPNNEDLINEEDYTAWKELRLHPLLMKAIYKLGFKEPTPIQKACIPAAAHKGKDVIGAAETGSGKTLAFGLPILQRLLDEQEKCATSSTSNDEKVNYALRALIIAPTRELAMQVTDHLRAVAHYTNIKIISIVGGMFAQKQERLLKRKPEIIVGTPGRLWELMSQGNDHLVELHSLSFFVLDEADRMIENGHFQELQFIMEMLPVTTNGSSMNKPRPTELPNLRKYVASDDHVTSCDTVYRAQLKKRQILMFSATVALSENFRKKLKKASLKVHPSKYGSANSIETLVERAGIREDAAVIDLTSSSIVVHKLEEALIECREQDKESYLYYVLCIHGRGRTIIFCTSVTALRRVSSILRILGLSIWTLHGQMQQRARLKAIDHFRESNDGILIATDVAARGIDVPGVRTVIHFQLPHSAEVYIHRSGRTARASADGCSIALISPDDRLKLASLCKSFSKETLNPFPVDNSYIPEIVKRLSLARQIDRELHKNSQENAKKSWFKRNAESLGLDMSENDSEDERVGETKRKKQAESYLNKMKRELNVLLSRPLQPKTFSHRFVAAAGLSPLVQQQLKEMSAKNHVKNRSVSKKGRQRSELVVIGRNQVEPLDELKNTQV